MYFRDPDGNELEVYGDNPPEEFVPMPNASLGREKSDFAQQDPGLADVLAATRRCSEGGIGGGRHGRGDRPARRQ